MTSTPSITIYSEGDFNYADWRHSIEKAILIFSKNLGYNKKLQRTRVNIHLGNEERIHPNGSIKSIWTLNNLIPFSQASGLDRINLVLKKIFDSLLTIGKVEGWDLQAIEKAYQLSIEDNGNFVWHSKFKSNKKRNLKARIKVLYEESKVSVTAEFFDNKSNFQFEVPIIDTFLHFFNWYNVFSKPGWLDDTKFGYSLINSQLQIFANAQSEQSETVILEKSWTLEQIEGQLRMLTYRDFANNKEYVDWVSK